MYVKYISTQVSGINFASGTCYTPVLRRIFRRLQNSNCWIFFNYFQRWTRQRRRWARRTRRGWSSLYGGLMFPCRSLEVKLSFLRERCGGFWPKLWTEKMDDLQYKFQQFEIWSWWKILFSTGVCQVTEAKFIPVTCVLMYLRYTKFQASKIIFVTSGTFKGAAKFIVADCMI